MVAKGQGPGAAGTPGARDQDPFSKSLKEVASGDL